MAVLAIAGCEDITNPVEEFGQLAGPYVRFENPGAIGTPASRTLVIFQLPTRVEEDVTIQYKFGGNAVFGRDYLILDRLGNPRNDVTAAGGTAKITYRFEQTSFGRDTLIVFVPFDATDGRTLEVSISGATTSSGRVIETGYIDKFRTFKLNIEGFIAIPEGAYTGQRTGSLGTANAAVTITKPAQPIVIEGAQYQYRLSDYTGDAGVFGVAVPWAFNVTSSGTVQASSRSSQFASVTSTVTGTYNRSTNTLRLNITLTCCGGNGLTWTLNVTKS